MSEQTTWRPWMDTVRVGDVLRSRTGLTRIVRRVSRRASMRPGYKVLSVDFAIKRCSWTRQCHTTLTNVELCHAGYEPVGIRMRLASDLDQKIAHDCETKSNEPALLTCCDVEGVY